MRVSEFFSGVTEQVRSLQSDGMLDNDSAEFGIELLAELNAVIINRRGDFEIEDPSSFVVILQAHAALMAALDRVMGDALVDVDDEELGVG